MLWERASDVHKRGVFPAIFAVIARTVPYGRVHPRGVWRPAVRLVRA